jgi:hypothetical protein
LLSIDLDTVIASFKAAVLSSTIKEPQEKQQPSMRWLYSRTIPCRYSTKRGVVTYVTIHFDLDTVVDAIGISVELVPLTILTAPITFDALAFDTQWSKIHFDTQAATHEPISLLLDMVVATDLAFVLFLLVIFQSSYNYRDLWLPYPPWTNFIFFTFRLIISIWLRQ